MGAATKTPRARAAAGERGAIVLLAIAFIAVMGVIFSALLVYAHTGSASLTAYRIERTRRYAADAALQLAVHRVANEPLLDTTSSTTCLSYPVVEEAAAPEVVSVVAPGSTVTVNCVNTPGAVVSSVDVDGGQAPRDITFEVICQNDGSLAVDNQLSCGSGGTSTVIGEARVRYENDYDAAVPSDERAIVPKIVSWRINLG